MSFSRLSTWERMETSRDDTGSSSTIRSGLRGQRPGDADALALAAAELVGELGLRGGLEAHGAQRLDDALVALGPRNAMHFQRLADDVADTHSRIQRAVGVLKYGLHVSTVVLLVSWVDISVREEPR